MKIRNTVNRWGRFLDAPEIRAVGAVVVHGGIGAEQRGRCQRETLGTGGRVQRPGGRTPVRFRHWVHEYLAGGRGAPHPCNRPIPPDLERRASAGPSGIAMTGIDQSAEGRVGRVLRRPCYHCGRRFKPTRPHQKRCRPSCRMAAVSARAGRPSLPGMLEGELFRVPFE
jgi:hypothetical protein